MGLEADHEVVALNIDVAITCMLIYTLLHAQLLIHSLSAGDTHTPSVP